jgi:hypothetical protein
MKRPSTKLSSVINHFSKPSSLSRQTRQRIPIFIDCLTTFNSRSHERRLSSFSIIGFVRGSETLTTAAWKVDHELGRHEACDCATKLFLESQDGGERGTEVFDAADEVACVDIVLVCVSIWFWVTV